MELMDVEIALGDMDTEEIVQVEVELEYDDPGSGFRVEKTVLMKPNNPPVRWKLRLGNDAKREYRFRRRYFFKTGNVQLQTDWETTQDPALIINEPFQGERNVRLFPLLDANNLLEAVVDLDYHEPQTGYRRKFQRVLTGPVLAGESIVIPTVLPDPAPISFEATIIHADGSVFQSGTITTPDNVALVSEGAGTTQRIRVRLPNNSVGALVAIKVDLTGMGEEPDTTTALFTPSQTADQTVALAQPAANQMRYTYPVSYTHLDAHPRQDSDPVAICRAYVTQSSVPIAGHAFQECVQRGDDHPQAGGSARPRSARRPPVADARPRASPRSAGRDRARATGGRRHQMCIRDSLDSAFAGDYDVE